MRARGRGRRRARARAAGCPAARTAPPTASLGGEAGVGGARAGQEELRPVLRLRAAAPGRPARREAAAARGWSPGCAGSGRRRAASASPPAASITCSKLSSRTSSDLSATCAARPSSAPSARAVSSSTSSGSRSAASGTQKTPSGKASAASPAACRARRVLPVPPGPVSVSRRSPAARAGRAPRRAPAPGRGRGSPARAGSSGTGSSAAGNSLRPELVDRAPGRRGPSAGARPGR